MNRDEQIQRHRRNLEDAGRAARRGQIINLSALIGGMEQIHADDIDGRTVRRCASDHWRVPQRPPEDRPELPQD